MLSLATIHAILYFDYRIALDAKVVLQAGSLHNNGRLEVCVNGTWVRVCDDNNYWSDVEAHIACRQLGYHDGEWMILCTI